MRKSVLQVIFACSALAGAFTLAAQAPDQAAAPTAADIVAKHLAAVGGNDAIAKVKSLSMEASVQVMGNDAPSTTTILNGVGYKMETDFNGTKIVQCFNDKGGWQVNPMAGAADPTPMSDDEYKTGKDQINIGAPLVDYATNGTKLELVSKDAGTYKVKVTTKDNVESMYVFDAATYYVKSLTRKGNMQGQEVDVTTNFSDYRKTETGYAMPYTMDIDFGGQFSLSIAIKKVEVNKTVDPAIFEMPKAAAPAAAPAKPAA